MFKKRFFALVATALALCTVVSHTTTAAALDTNVPSEEGATVVRTWRNDKGKSATGIITRGSEVLVVRTQPDEGEASGFVTTVRNDAIVSPSALDEYEVSDSFYMQIYNSNDQIVAKYKVTLKGMVSRVSSYRHITSVSFSHIFGDACVTEYSMVNEYTALVVIIHPVEGYLHGYFRLGTGGSFTVY